MDVICCIIYKPIICNNIGYITKYLHLFVVFNVKMLKYIFTILRLMRSQTCSEIYTVRYDRRGLKDLDDLGV